MDRVRKRLPVSFKARSRRGRMKSGASLRFLRGIGRMKLRGARPRFGGLRSDLREVTKKDFRAIADILCKHGASSRLVDDLSAYFATENPRFNRSLFASAVSKCAKEG